MRSDTGATASSRKAQLLRLLGVTPEGDGGLLIMPTAGSSGAAGADAMDTDNGSVSNIAALLASSKPHVIGCARRSGSHATACTR